MERVTCDLFRFVRACDVKLRALAIRCCKMGMVLKHAPTIGISLVLCKWFDGEKRIASNVRWYALGHIVAQCFWAASIFVLAFVWYRHSITSASATIHEKQTPRNEKYVRVWNLPQHVPAWPQLGTKIVFNNLEIRHCSCNTLSIAWPPIAHACDSVICWVVASKRNQANHTQQTPHSYSQTFAAICSITVHGRVDGSGRNARAMSHEPWVSHGPWVMIHGRVR
jgi:hypothetical protein